MDDKPKDINVLDDLTPDSGNANKGNERGNRLLEDSLREFGAGRSIVTDKHGTVIGGNKTLEQAAALGFEIEVVKTDGQKLVVVQRTDLDLTIGDDKARRLAYADNRVGQIDLDWDADQVLKDMAAGVDLEPFFNAMELQQLVAPGESIEDAWQGMPEYEHDDLRPHSSLIVHFTTQEDRDGFAALVGQNLTEKTKFIWHPKVEIQRTAGKSYEDTDEP